MTPNVRAALEKARNEIRQCIDPMTEAAYTLYADDHRTFGDRLCDGRDRLIKVVNEIDAVLSEQPPAPEEKQMRYTSTKRRIALLEQRVVSEISKQIDGEQERRKLIDQTYRYGEKLAELQLQLAAAEADAADLDDVLGWLHKIEAPDKTCETCIICSARIAHRARIGGGK